MVAQVLPPGVEHGGDPQRGVEVVATELQQRGRGTGEQQGIEPRWVVLDEPVQFVREGEHGMEVRDGQEVFDLLFQPLSTVEFLAARTMPVATGVGHEMLALAVGAPILMATQRRGVTGGEGAQHLPMMNRQAMRMGERGQRGAHDFPQGDGLRLTGP